LQLGEQLAARGTAHVLDLVRHDPVDARSRVACGRQTVVRVSIVCRFFVADSGDVSGSRRDWL
jgi:hypothetical protein